MKKLYVLFLLCFFLKFTHAQTFNDGVLEYTVTDAINNYVSVKKYNNICPTGIVTIPQTTDSSGTTYTITSISNDAFNSCINTTSINIPESVTYIGDNAFTSCTSITNINLPESLTYIGDLAFFYCTALTNITIPESITTINFGAFYFCTGLTIINLPDSLISIEDNAFDFCTSLINVKVNLITPLNINTSVFANINLTSATLTIPSGSLSSYQNTAVWQDFGAIVEDATLSTTNILLKNNVSLYPNPAKNQVNIQLQEGLVLNQVNIYNTLGQFISTSKENIINTSHLSQGIYLIEIKTNSGKATKQLIIK